MTIGQFLLRLASDEGFLRSFGEDPEAAMREAGLDDRQIQFLLAANLGELRVKVEAELNVSDEKVAIITIFTIPTIFTLPPPPPPPTEE